MIHNLLKPPFPLQLNSFAIRKAGALRELREMANDTEAYFEDDWNIMDVLGLVVLLAGFVFRSSDSTSPWGRALYALSAPLVFSRALFFAQVLQFQGPMIQARTATCTCCSEAFPLKELVPSDPFTC